MSPKTFHPTQLQPATPVVLFPPTIIKSNKSQIARPRKAILIGHQGKAIKKLGIEARKDIEEFIGKRCFLSLHIKVLKDWRNSERALKSFGYSLED